MAFALKRKAFSRTTNKRHLSTIFYDANAQTRDDDESSLP